MNYACRVSSSAVSITANIEKIAYQPWWKNARLSIYGSAAGPKEVRIGEQTTHEWRYDSLAHAITLTVPDATKNWSIHLAF